MQGQTKRELLGLSSFKATFVEPYVIFNKMKLTMRIDVSPYGNEYRQIGEPFRILLFLFFFLFSSSLNNPIFLHPSRL